MVTLRLPIGPAIELDDTADEEEMVDDVDEDDMMFGGWPIGVIDRPEPGAARGLAVIGTLIGGMALDASAIVGPGGPLVAIGGINDDIFDCCCKCCCCCCCCCWFEEFS